MDVAYGGNFYAIVDVQDGFPGMEHYTADQLIAWGRALREDINKRYTFVHPEEKSINGCSHILWTGKPIDASSTARGAVIYGERQLIAHHAVQALLREWHSGMQKASCRLVNHSNMKALSAVSSMG